MRVCDALKWSFARLFWLVVARLDRDNVSAFERQHLCLSIYTPLRTWSQGTLLSCESSQRVSLTTMILVCYWAKKASAHCACSLQLGTKDYWGWYHIVLPPSTRTTRDVCRIEELPQLQGEESPLSFPAPVLCVSALLSIQPFSYTPFHPNQTPLY